MMGALHDVDLAQQGSAMQWRAAFHGFSYKVQSIAGIALMRCNLQPSELQ